MIVSNKEFNEYFNSIDNHYKFVIDDTKVAWYAKFFERFFSTNHHVDVVTGCTDPFEEYVWIRKGLENRRLHVGLMVKEWFEYNTETSTFNRGYNDDCKWELCIYDGTFHISFDNMYIDTFKESEKRRLYSWENDAKSKDIPSYILIGNSYYKYLFYPHGEESKVPEDIRKIFHI